MKHGCHNFQQPKVTYSHSLFYATNSPEPTVSQVTIIYDKAKPGFKSLHLKLKPANEKSLKCCINHQKSLNRLITMVTKNRGDKMAHEGLITL